VNDKPKRAASPAASPAAPPDAERLRRINALLQAALALPPEQRAAWLQGLPQEHAPLKGVLSAMLARGAVETDTFLRTPLALDDEALMGLEPDTDQAGAEVGPWRLISPLGQGGMAAVWLAQRTDGELHRQVALKLPRVGGGPALAQRMQRERDILAQLVHPHIARLYDAGTTAEGRPWLAMERVQGLAIDRHCQQPQHSVPQILRLFLQVTAAVAHAHAQLVVHRDLKPNNILVTEAGEVRLLDFGVAKLLAPDTPITSDMTQLLGRAVTPDYASPEQVSGRPVTVATDIYSLGVVLYELLTGKRPYRLQRSTMAALEEAILAADVPLASRRVADQPRLARELRGDLDTILGKALRKNSAERYPSVESFAADIQRYLDGEPVLAQPRSRRYRTAKFVRRHRVGVAACAAVALSLCMGLGVALWQAHAAQQQAALARSRMIDAEAAMEFASALVGEGIRPGERLSHEELLKRGAELALSTPVSRARDRVMAVDAVTTWYMNFGRYADADALMDSVFAGMSPSQITAGMLCKRGSVKGELGQREDALRLMAAGIAGAANDPETASLCLLRRARMARNNNDAPAALRDAQAALDQYEQSGRQSNRTRANLLGELGYALSISGRSMAADERYRNALQLYESSGWADNPVAMSVRNNWGVAQIGAGDPQAALVQFQRAMVSAQRGGAQSPVPLYLQFNLGNALRLLARYDEAALTLRALATEAAQRGSLPTQLGALNGLAAIALVRGQHAQAQAWLDEGAALLVQGSLSPDSPTAMGHRYTQAELLLALGRAAEASAQFTQLMDQHTRLKLNIGRVSALWVQRSRAQAAQGQAATALADAQRGIEVGAAIQGERRHSSYTGEAWLQVARLHAAADRWPQAHEATQQALDHLQATLGADHPMVLEAQQLRTTLR
jgi:eukaryotic-like serine/threonine-protein kinase